MKRKGNITEFIFWCQYKGDSSLGTIKNFPFNVATIISFYIFEFDLFLNFYLFIFIFREETLVNNIL